LPLKSFYPGPVSTGFTTQKIVGEAGTFPYYQCDDVTQEGTVTVTTSYTPKPMVGSKAIQAVVDSNPPGTAEAFEFTATTTGTVWFSGLYIDASNTGTGITYGLYSNTASNTPGTLLTHGSASHPVTNGEWMSGDGSTFSTSVTKGTKYWIALLAPYGTIKFRDGQQGGRSQLSAETNLTELPTTWTPGTKFSTQGPLSAYFGG
jgi:hypothetical protein